MDKGRDLAFSRACRGSSALAQATLLNINAASAYPYYTADFMERFCCRDNKQEIVKPSFRAEYPA